MPSKAAVIVVVPVASVEARPAGGVEIVATDAVADAQVTCDGQICGRAVRVGPVAVNCSVRPLAMLGLAGVTAIDSRAAAVTVSVSSGW